MVKKLYDRMGKKVYSRHADLVLGLLFFAEAIFFLPVDPVLIMYCLERRSKALYFAAIATLSSVLGGIVGYYIGATLWYYVGEQILQSPMISYFLSRETFEYLSMQYHRYAGWAILLAAFTPIPYKAATLTAGFCNLALLPFIVASFIGRGARFFLYGTLISIWGVQIKQYIDRYFNLLVLLALVLISLGIWLSK